MVNRRSLRYCFGRGIGRWLGRSAALEAGAGAAEHDPDRRGERHRQGLSGPGDSRGLFARGAARSSGSTRPIFPTSSSRARCSATSAGAFTGAVTARRGLLEAAADGTAYLDDASSLSPAAQAKLLRVLQEKTFRRLGGAAAHTFRARLLVSSRSDLSALVEDGIFRPDLFYRIDVLSVRLPRLDRSARGHPSSGPEFPEEGRPILRAARAPFARGGGAGSPAAFVARETSASSSTSSSEQRWRASEAAVTPAELPAGALGSPGGDPGGRGRKALDAAPAFRMPISKRRCGGRVETGRSPQNASAFRGSPSGRDSGKSRYARKKRDSPSPLRRGLISFALSGISRL